MSNLINHAIRELKSIGMYGSEDEMNRQMVSNIMELLQVLSSQGHSGFSHSYLMRMFTKLADFKPIGPLTGEDSEWNDVSSYGGSTMYQNNRCPSVFKDENGAYNIDGKVFWEWALDEQGEPLKSYYGCRDSRVPVTFPYVVPDKPIYEYRRSDAEPPSPPQTEKGIVFMFTFP